MRRARGVWHSQQPVQAAGWQLVQKKGQPKHADGGETMMRRMAHSTVYIANECKHAATSSPPPLTGLLRAVHLVRVHLVQQLLQLVLGEPHRVLQQENWLVCSASAACTNGSARTRGHARPPHPPRTCSDGSSFMASSVVSGIRFMMMGISNGSHCLARSLRGRRRARAARLSHYCRARARGQAAACTCCMPQGSAQGHHHVRADDLDALLVPRVRKPLCVLLPAAARAVVAVRGAAAAAEDCCTRAWGAAGRRARTLVLRSMGDGWYAVTFSTFCFR